MHLVHFQVSGWYNQDKVKVFKGIKSSYHSHSSIQQVPSKSLTVSHGFGARLVMGPMVTVDVMHEQKSCPFNNCTLN